MNKKYFVIKNRVGLSAFVVDADMDDTWTPQHQDGWTYQQLGGRGLVDGPYDTFTEADDERKSWLEFAKERARNYVGYRD
jgi:hypothetical protein